MLRLLLLLLLLLRLLRLLLLLLLLILPPHTATATAAASTPPRSHYHHHYQYDDDISIQGQWMRSISLFVNSAVYLRWISTGPVQALPLGLDVAPVPAHNPQHSAHHR